jgi:hypothetical protein
MLLLSVASLGLFYLAPVRFGQLISRLPGESLIRTALVFAPATLFAIVVLAILYAIEQPVDSVRTRPQRMRAPLVQRLKSLGQWLLGPTAIVSIVSLGLTALAFVSEERFNRLLAPLPGDSYWKPLVPISPWVLFPLTLILAYLAFSPTEKGAEPSTFSRRKSLLDSAVVALLFFSVPSLFVSTAAFIIFRLRPERVNAILERLPFDTLVRLLLLMAPPTFFAVVMLAVLFLLGTKTKPEPIGMTTSSDQRVQAGQELRSRLAMGVLVAGLSLTAFLGIGSLGALVYILLR